MELDVFVSKKGTKVVASSALHQALQLADHHYGMNVKRWINDVYEFSDGIRKPIKMQDFAPRKQQTSTLHSDYFLSLELAKQIVLRSKSKLKMRFAKELADANQEALPHELSSGQIQHLIALTKAMTLVSCQEECERRHLRQYKDRNAGSAANWWIYRAELMGYDKEELRDKLRRKHPNAVLTGNHRQLLSSLDPLELIRAGMIDLFMSIGKTAEYAIQMGNLSKQLAASMDLQLIDDQKQVDLFTTSVDPELVHRLKAPLAAQLVAA